MLGTPYLVDSLLSAVDGVQQSVANCDATGRPVPEPVKAAARDAAQLAANIREAVRKRIEALGHQQKEENVPADEPSQADREPPQAVFVQPGTLADDATARTLDAGVPAADPTAQPSVDPRVEAQKA